MKLGYLIVLVVGLLFGGSLKVEAQGTKKVEEVEITADQSELSLSTHKALFKGNVVIVDPPDTQVKCDQLTINLSTNNSEIVLVLAEGNVTITLKNKDGVYTATGKNAVFDWQTNILTLTGEPVINTPMGPFTGAEKVVLDRTKGNMFASGGRQRLGLDPKKVGRDDKKKTDGQKSP